MKLLRDVQIHHLLTVDAQASLHRAATVMTDRGVGSAVVIEDGGVAGIITERDILHSVAEGIDLDSTTVEEKMTRDPVSGTPGWDLIKAVRTMVDGGFRHLLVMEMDDPVGIVSLRDLMDHMAALLQEAESSSSD
ncbi:MAG: CBS domain-containing protein [Actinomycetota bacterium]